MSTINIILIIAVLVLIAGYVLAKFGSDKSLIPEILLNIYYKNKIGRVFIERMYVEWKSKAKTSAVEYYTLEEVKDGFVLLSKKDRYGSTGSLVFIEKQIGCFHNDFKQTSRINKSVIFNNGLGDL